jgi:hypothetical protein
MTTTTKATSSKRCEFDQMFEDLEASDYTATCDQCGIEGTNQAMEEHVCEGDQTMTTTTKLDPKTKCTSCGMTRDAHWGRNPIAAPFCTGFVKPPTPPERVAGEHTPLPWRVAHDEIDGDEIVAENGLTIAMVYGTYKRLNPHNDSSICHANAQLIVTAVNNHAQLVAALEGLMSRFEQTGEAWMSDPAWIAASEALNHARSLK